MLRHLCWRLTVLKHSPSTRSEVEPINENSESAVSVFLEKIYSRTKSFWTERTFSRTINKRVRSTTTNYVTAGTSSRNLSILNLPVYPSLGTYFLGLPLILIEKPPLPGVLSPTTPWGSRLQSPAYLERKYELDPSLSYSPEFKVTSWKLRANTENRQNTTDAQTILFAICNGRLNRKKGLLSLMRIRDILRPILTAGCHSSQISPNSLTRKS